MRGLRARRNAREQRGVTAAAPRPAARVAIRSGGQTAKHPRVRELHAKGATVKDVAALARVAYRTAQMWAAEEIDSPRCDEAYRKLTGQAA
jgi:hypothetical protein